MVNWKTMIVEMHGNIKEMKPKVDAIADKSDDHEARIRLLETAKSTSNGYHKAKDKFYEKHPVKTAVGGSISLTSLLALGAFVLDKLGVI